ncbi:MAG: hypothetical protein IJF07_01610, partial [Lachnospiraceae bacterium]|nr:hypothetical protein [Lachnospiraceae bacterium]
LDTSIQIIMNKETEYYLCFYNMDFVGEKQLYYYLNTTKKYTEATIKEDSGYYYVAGYYGGLRPVYQSETFYIGEIPEK